MTFCTIKLNDEYETEQYLTLTCIGSPAGVITSFESSIIFKAMSATWTAWVLLSLCKPPATQYASPMVSTWTQQSQSRGRRKASLLSYS